MADEREKIIIDIKTHGQAKAKREIKELDNSLKGVEGTTKRIKPHIRAMGVAVAKSTEQTKRWTKEQDRRLDAFNRNHQRAMKIALREDEVMSRSIVKTREKTRATAELSGGVKLVSRAFHNTHHGIAAYTQDITRARVDTGFMSVSLRSMLVLLGAASANAATVTGPIVGLARGLGTGALGLGAAGAIGVSALVQGMGVAALATKDLTEAWDGNEEALARLSATQFRFLQGLDAMRPKFDALRNAAADGMLPGVGRGIGRASRNLPRVRTIAGGTGRAIGGLASRAGGMLGSDAFGRDFSRLGRANIFIIKELGNAALDLGDALRNVLIPAIPLAKWLASSIRDGAMMVRVWAANSRESGKTARFWGEARSNLALIWKIARQFTGGIINLFGADDADGQKALKALDRITARFERWTRSKDVQKNLGRAIQEQMPMIAGIIASAVAEGLVKGAVNGIRLLGAAFETSNLWGKGLIALIVGSRLGAFKLLSKGIVALLTRSMARTAGPAIGGAIASSLTRGGVVSGMRGALMMFGRRLGLAIAIGAGLALAQHLGNKIDQQLDFWTSSMGAGDRDPTVQRVRRHVNNPSTQQAMRRWESKHFNVLDRFGTSWSKEELQFLRRNKYPGLDPGRHVGTLRSHNERPVVSVQVDRREIARAGDNHRRREGERR